MAIKNYRSTIAVLALGLFVVNASHAYETDKGAIEKCSTNLGTLAVVEPQSHMLASLQRYSLGSPSTMLRMIAEESGCFTVVERGVALQNIRQERELASAGQLQQGSNVGGGQLQAADFVMTPSVQFASDTGGVGGAIGGLFGRMGGVLGAIGGIAGGVKFKEAETTLLLSDVRSGIQVASAEGKASKMDFSLGGWGWGGFGWASAGGYSKTPEGKLIAASLLDNYNKIVANVRDKSSLVQSTSVASRNNAANSIQATAPSQVAAQQYDAKPMPSPAVKPMASSGLSGMYVVKFTGDDEGSINVMINKSGNVKGMGKSTKTNMSFNVAGNASPDGEVLLSTQGKGGEVKFMGNIDLQTGAVVGMWQSGDNASTQGTFSGQKK